jgi:hypothetical protein
MSLILPTQGLLAAGGGGGTPPADDPYFANVVALLHFDGADSSTTMTDVTGKVWTPFGNAQIDTAQSKFGGSSLLLDGTGDYMTTPSSADFAYGTGDFTWECWFRPLLISLDNRYILDHGANGGTFHILVASNRVAYYNPTTGINSELYNAGPIVSLNTWYHIAYCRQSGTTSCFIDGVPAVSGADGYDYAAQVLSIGQYGGGGFNFAGHIDEFRITKGVARYTGAFTPPTAPFPDS